MSRPLLALFGPILSWLIRGYGVDGEGQVLKLAVYRWLIGPGRTLLCWPSVGKRSGDREPRAWLPVEFRDPTLRLAGPMRYPYLYPYLTDTVLKGYQVGKPGQPGHIWTHRTSQEMTQRLQQKRKEGQKEKKKTNRS